MTGQWSPDGSQWWDGTAWRQVSPDKKQYYDGNVWTPIPASAAASPPPGPGQPLPKKSGGRGKWIAIIIGSLIVLAVCGSLIQNAGKSTPVAETKPTAKPSASTPTAAPASTATPTKAPTATPRDGSCAPQPCANDNYGWIVNVSNFAYDAKSSNEFIHPEAGNVYAAMNVNFTNKTNSPQHANPFFFKLIDGGGISHNITFTADCPSWSPVDIAPGATYGPKCLVFEAVAGKPAGLILDWTPNGFGGDYKIKLS